MYQLWANVIFGWLLLLLVKLEESWIPSLWQTAVCLAIFGLNQSGTSNSNVFNDLVS